MIKKRDGNKGKSRGRGDNLAACIDEIYHTPSRKKNKEKRNERESNRKHMSEK